MQEKEIDGHVYQFSKFGAKKSLKILRRILGIIGEPFAVAMGSAKGDGKLFERQIDPSILAGAIKSLIDRADEDTVIQLMEDLCGESGCLCDGKKVLFDTHYESRLPHLFKVFRAALEVQYGDFFGGSLGALTKGPIKNSTLG
jgi:hypothetical protein